MTFLDVLMIFFLFLGLIIGFFKGMVKVLIALGTLYLSVILAGLYYRALATALSQNATTTTSIPILEMLSFLIVLVVSYIILLLTALYAFRYVEVGGRLQYLDKMLGTFFGFVLGAFFACLIAMLMNYIFVVQFTANTLDYPAMKMLQGSTQNSTLKDLFLDAILPLLYGPISPILPASADAIFGQLSR